MVCITYTYLEQLDFKRKQKNPTRLQAQKTAKQRNHDMQIGCPVSKSDQTVVYDHELVSQYCVSTPCLFLD